jgi:SAM-dependent methyltransferase
VADKGGSDRHIEETRRGAVALHEEKAADFQRSYDLAGRSPYGSAFCYGRKKLGEILAPVLAEVPAGGRLLDIGCGTGAQLALAARQGLHAIGIEPAREMRRLAQENCPTASVMGGSIFDLPLKDASVDVVVCIEVLRYFQHEDVLRAYREMRRVLAPGGVLFAVLVNRYAADGFLLYHHASRLIGGLLGRRPAHCDFTTPGEAARELLAAGFSRVETRGCLFGGLRIPYRLNNRLGAMIAKAAEPLDDAVCGWSWTRSLAGHLVATGHV